MIIIIIINALKKVHAQISDLCRQHKKTHLYLVSERGINNIIIINIIVVFINQKIKSNHSKNFTTMRIDSLGMADRAGRQPETLGLLGNICKAPPRLG